MLSVFSLQHFPASVYISILGCCLSCSRSEYTCTLFAIEQFFADRFVPFSHICIFSASAGPRISLNLRHSSMATRLKASIGMHGLLHCDFIPRI
jgi:hypothetical protein